MAAIEVDPLGSRLVNWMPHNTRRSAAAFLRSDRFDRYQQLRRTTVGDGYSFEGFDRLGCVFVHVPKAAGISVAQGLFGNLGGGHVPISAYRIIYAKAEFDSYFKFAFVRDPFDRLLSAWEFLAGGGMNDDDRAWWTANDMGRFPDFAAFARGWLTPENAARSVHFLPQHHYLCAPRTRRILVDFVGRYEHLDRDYAHVRATLGLEPSELPRLNQTHKEHRVPRPSPDLRMIVRDVYRTDYDLFDYE